MKYKIFDYCWHIPHQADMINALADYCEFYLCLNTKASWDANSVLRARPNGLKFVTHYEPGKYDLAILHVDQQVIIEGGFKRMMFDHFNARINDIPKIIINHGTPVYPDAFKGLMLSDHEMKSRCVDEVRRLVGNNPMVVNSHDSASEKEWGFGIPIVHGMDHGEWYDLPKEPRVFTALSSAGLDEYYNRRCLNMVKEHLEKVYGYVLWHAKVNVKTNQSINSYKEFLGRSLLYLDTSVRTPMNRARTEAFLSGCCVIQVDGAHDLERWAKRNENIILVQNDPRVIAKLIVEIIETKYSLALKIGQQGKKMAIERFSRSRYQDSWLKLIRSVIGHGKI